MTGAEGIRDAGSSRDRTAARFAAAVDELLAGHDRVSSEEEVCAVLAAGVRGDVPREESAACLEEALKNPAAPRHQSVLTASLLRLLAHPEATWIYEVRLRQDICSYLERSLPPSLLKSAGVIRGQQTHDKLVKIRQAVDKWDEQFHRAVAPLPSLDSYALQRQKTMSFLKGEFGSTLVQPFLVSDWEPPFLEYYRALERYLDVASTPDVVKARSDFRDSSDELKQCLSDLPSRYSAWLVDALCESNLRLFEDVFAENPAARPGNLRVEWSSKKYKLYEQNAKLDLAVRVRNDGPGYADGVLVSLEADESLETEGATISLGSLPPGKELSVAIPAVVLAPCSACLVNLTVKWQDFDGSGRAIEEIVEAKSQNPDIAWEALEGDDPYSLDPVETVEDLVGRQELLARLKAITSGKSVGSAIIRGQKRVGKTSIAKVLASELAASDFTVAFVEAGQVVSSSPHSTVKRLGQKLCSGVQRNNKAAATLAVPDFEEHGLSQLDDFLEGLGDVQPNARVVFVIDEFDQLPPVLYSRDLDGDAFFESLRSASSRKNVGFLLVGGEKMKRILEQQGVKLNKWVTFSVDYFEHWNDFEELVIHPTREYLEFSDDAMDRLYRETAGNPYFTNLVCQRVVEAALRTRDGHVTAAEAEKALTDTVREVDVSSFSHFWEDGILDSGPLRDEKTLNRRKVLIALADSCAHERPASLASIVKQRVIVGVPSVESELREFVSRDVLVEEPKDHFSFKVPLFERWLDYRGISEVIQAADCIDAAAEQRLQRQRLRVGPEEIEALLQPWGKRYRGETFGEAAVRDWLEQFGEEESQRAMFSLLCATRFITWEYLIGKMAEVNGIVRLNLKRGYDNPRKKRGDVAVSYLDGVAKSGADIARLYADKAKIYRDHVREPSALAELVSGTEGIKVALFMDDFVGTGTQAKEYLAKHETLISGLKADGLRVLFVTMVAHTQGAEALEKFIDKKDLGIEFHALEYITDEDKVFRGARSRFSDQDQKRKAEEICAYRGKQLDPKNPMGYGDLELALVFERGCPNNSLPVFWSDRGGFLPLFHRR